MDRGSKISKLFAKTVCSIKRQINLALRKHTISCWRYYLAYDYKYQGCESMKFTKNKLICNQRSKSLDNLETVLQLNKTSVRSSSFECISSNKYKFDLQLKDVYDIQYECECDY